MNLNLNKNGGVERNLFMIFLLCFWDLWCPSFWCEKFSFFHPFLRFLKPSKSKVAAKVDLASPRRISNVWAEPWSRWWFVSKSGKLTSWGWWLVVYPNIYRVLLSMSQVVVRISSINSIKQVMMINDHWLQQLYRQCFLCNFFYDWPQIDCSNLISWLSFMTDHHNTHDVENEDTEKLYLCLSSLSLSFVQMQQSMAVKTLS